jgi:hypothetical protein
MAMSAVLCDTAHWPRQLYVATNAGYAGTTGIQAGRDDSYAVTSST